MRDKFYIGVTPCNATTKFKENLSNKNGIPVWVYRIPCLPIYLLFQRHRPIYKKTDSTQFYSMNYFFTHNIRQPQENTFMILPHLHSSYIWKNSAIYLIQSLLFLITVDSFSHTPALALSPHFYTILPENRMCRHNHRVVQYIFLTLIPNNYQF